MSDAATIEALTTEDRLRWSRALRRWGLGVDLSVPVPLAASDDIAYIDLRTRQTHVNFALLDALELSRHVEAIFAHEAGHHCRYPQTLVAAAKLVRRQRKLLAALELDQLGGAKLGRSFLPGELASLDHLVNLVLDVRINDALRDEYGDDFRRVYSTLLGREGSVGSVFAFTMAVYDALWNHEGEASLATGTLESRLDEVWSTWREEARTLARELRDAGENTYLYQDLFLEATWPYIVDDLERRRDLSTLPVLEAAMGRDLDGLEPDELVAVVRRTREERSADDARELRRHPVLVELPPDPDEVSASARPEDEPRNLLADVIEAATELGRPPVEMPLLIRQYYEREAEKIEIEIERAPRSEPLVPTTLTAWEVEEEVSDIDWVASLGRSGAAIPGMTLLRRDREPDVVGSGALEPPWIEIYVDGSASMPDPSKEWSHLAFAGLLLARAAIRAGAMVRVIAFSGTSQVSAMDTFTCDGSAAFEALLTYYGDGTAFPFDLLAESLERHRTGTEILRVALTDTDFFHNVGKKGTGREREIKLDLLRRAAQRPLRFVAILNIYGQGLEVVKSWPFYPEDLPSTGVELVTIDDWNELQGVAVSIGDEVFGKRGSRS